MTANFDMPIPGEPIDIVFFTQLATYLKQIHDDLFGATHSLSSIAVGGGLRETQETEDLSIWTGEFHIATSFPKGQDPKKVESQKWNVNFEGVSFQSTPIVTVTPRCTTGGTISPNTAWISSVSRDAANGRFKFIEAPKNIEQITINIIAIGKGMANVR
jgi:hypothetical protein